MKYKEFFITFFMFLTFYCNSQFKDYNNTIGFTCGGSGSLTPILNRTYQMIKDKNYNTLKTFLISNNASENFIGVVICEKFKEKGILLLTEKEIEKILKLYKSNKKVEVCDGCGEGDLVKLSTLLFNKDKSKIREEFELWLNESLN